MNSNLSLVVGARGQRSILKDCFYTPPLKLLTLNPIQSCWPDALHIMQMSASPGLLSGDVQKLDITLLPDTALHLTTQAYQRVLSMHDSAYAIQDFDVKISDGARLWYLPHPMVLHQDASLKQTVLIRMGDHSELIWGEIIAPGRHLNGEYFAFKRLSSRLRIEHHDQPLLLDNIQWQPSRHPLAVLGQMEGFTHQASLYYAHTGVVLNQDVIAAIQTIIETYEMQRPSQFLAGVSMVSECVLQLRALANEAEVLEQLLPQCAMQIQSVIQQTVCECR